MLKDQVKMTKDLQKYRKKIDKIDKKLQKHLEKRGVLVEKIGEVKKENKIKITDKTREKEILGKIKNTYVKKIFKSIIEISKEAQR